MVEGDPQVLHIAYMDPSKNVELKNNEHKVTSS